RTLPVHVAGGRLHHEGRIRVLQCRVPPRAPTGRPRTKVALAMGMHPESVEACVRRSTFKGGNRRNDVMRRAGRRFMAATAKHTGEHGDTRLITLDKAAAAADDDDWVVGKSHADFSGVNNKRD
ncbi:hypothetical protein TcCL_NonESM02016, partial [Trypanosoma cruzi]